MYKITLYDQCCCPICDGTFFFFIEDLEEFEENWLPLQAKRGVDTINRYYESKFGKIVSDYYGDSEELNIVQKVDFEQIDEFEYEREDIDIELENAYMFATTVNFDRIIFKLIKAKVGDQYYLLGQYECYGGKQIGDSYNRWYDKNVKYSQMRFHGNPIAIYDQRKPDWDNRNSSDAYKDFYTNDKTFFKNETLKTFVWLPIQVIDEDFQLKELDEEQLKRLLCDILGEAG